MTDLIEKLRNHAAMPDGLRMSITSEEARLIVYLVSLGNEMADNLEHAPTPIAKVWRRARNGNRP